MRTVSVLILTQESCGFCDAAKAVLERLARKYPLSVSTVSLETAAGQELAEKGAYCSRRGSSSTTSPFATGARRSHSCEQKSSGGCPPATQGETSDES